MPVCVKVNKLNSRVSFITLNRVTGNVEHDFHKTVTHKPFHVSDMGNRQPKMQSAFAGLAIETFIGLGFLFQSYI